MSNYNKSPLERIVSATIEGLQSGDLSGLNDAVEDSVSMVLDNVEKKINKFGDIPTNGKVTPLSEHKEPLSSGQATRELQQKIARDKAKRAEAQKKEAQRLEQQKKARKEAAAGKNELVTLPSPFSPKGNVSSVLYMVGGGIGMGISGISLLGRLAQLAMGTVSLTAMAVGAGMFVVFGALTNNGIIQKRRLERAKRYNVLIGSKQYMDIDELALASNQSARRTMYDLKKMLKIGFFPQGHLDADKTTIMLSDSVFKEYQRTMRNRNAIEGSTKEVVDTSARVVEDSNSELNQMIQEGTDYISRLHAINEQIPGEVMTSKLNRLENILKELFKCVEKHPEQMPRMHEVMNYYLPTIMKLMEAYKEYDSLVEADKEILDAKKQIEGSIDTINGALRKILNNLFRDSVWDVTTDATVLNTMLTQKGLVSQFPEEDKAQKNE